MKPGIEQALRVDRSDRGELLDLRIVEDRRVERRVTDLAEEARPGGVLTDDDLVEGIDGCEECLSGQVSLEIAVHVDLYCAVSNANDDVVPVSLVPVSVGRKCTPLAPSPEDLVLDAFFRHGQVELLGAATTRREDRAVLARSAHAVAGEDRARSELREFGDVVIRQASGGKLDERSGGGRECEDLCRGENAVMLCEGSNVDAGSRREFQSSLGAAGSGG